jgi:hypothetical protein
VKLRVIHCEDESHDLTWVLAKDCPHWSMDCPRSKKAKKSHHKLKQSDERGFLVAVTGIPPEGWQYDYPPTPEALEPVESRYEGHWCPGPEYKWHDRCGVRPGNTLVQENSLGGVFVPGPRSNIVTCALGCGLKGAL